MLHRVSEIVKASGLFSGWKKKVTLKYDRGSCSFYTFLKTPSRTFALGLPQLCSLPPKWQTAAFLRPLGKAGLSYRQLTGRKDECLD